MRTTISLSDSLAEDVRRRAAQQGVSVSALIESFVRAGLLASAPERSVPEFRLVTAGAGGLQPGIDLERAARLTAEDDVEGTLARAGR